MANNNDTTIQMSLLGYIRKLWNDTQAALASKTPTSRKFHIFWLLGPFILLVERSPADAWLTVCALTFVGRAIIKKDGSWLKVFWVRTTFVFWGICLLSAVMSDNPIYSIGEAVAWIRFPLFAMASCFWLASDKRLLYAMMASTMLGMLTMSGILTAEILIVGQQGGRLSWPYGDLVPGNYLAKVGLPAFSVLIAVAVSAHRTVAIPAGLISLATITISVFTGERINFIIRACSGMLAALVWKPRLNRLFALIVIEIFAVIAIFSSSSSMGDRYLDKFFSELPIYEESPYKRVWNGGFEAFYTSPFIGIGPDNYRILCSKISFGSESVDCHTHPHNYYIQILAEVGVIGLFFALIMVGAIIYTCFTYNLKNRENVICATCVIVPVGLLFPIQTTADFFGQWNNIFMWTALGLALSSRNILDK